MNVSFTWEKEMEDCAEWAQSILLFEDDPVLIADSEECLQRMGEWNEWGVEEDG